MHRCERSAEAAAEQEPQGGRWASARCSVLVCLRLNPPLNRQRISPGTREEVPQHPNKTRPVPNAAICERDYFTEMDMMNFYSCSTA
jgi:hypothetical protein